jgi:hypothetical protein
MFLPICHAELNVIEQVPVTPLQLGGLVLVRLENAVVSVCVLPCHTFQLWHYIKGCLRKVLDGTKATLLKKVPEYLCGGASAPSQAMIDGWWKHVDKYLEAYEKGMTGLEAYKYVKLHSHRRGQKAGAPKKERVKSHHRVPHWVPPKASKL